MEISITCTLDELTDPRIAALLDLDASAAGDPPPDTTEGAETAAKPGKTAKKAAKKKAAKKEPETETEGEEEEPMDTLKGLFQELIADGQRSVAVGLLKDAGVMRVHEVAEDDIPDLIEKAREALEAII